MTEQNTQTGPAGKLLTPLLNVNWGLVIQLCMYHSFTRCIKLASRSLKHFFLVSEISSLTPLTSISLENQNTTNNDSMKHKIKTCST
ncbi:hypothetical protein Syun_006427 [Stephania yunnanensis]|uniref:Uncharacterized protein n=1 Tax=Stephania yunnanensis TaxID=152371 RepID=A0AAP0KWP1_9MAGN